jgi:prepilin-type N-terminal cleavage/methylation domain-containing protein
MNRQMQDDSGLTLIELLVAMSITLLIVTPLFSSFVLTLGQSQRSEQDITNSADAQTLTAFLTQDVANSDSVRVSSSCGGSTSILELKWVDGSTTHYVSYQTSATTLQGVAAQQVTRYECTAPAGPPVSTTTVVRSAAAVPVVQCDGVACTDATTKPTVLTFAVDDLGRTASELHYAFTLTGTRRVTT